MSLQRTLQRIREARANGTAPPKKLTPKHVGHASVFSNCGPNGERREHPTLYGLQWLCVLGLALEQLGIAWDSRVDATRWEFDECVNLHLQRPLRQEAAQPIVAMGEVVTPGQAAFPIAGGEWWTFRIPVGAVNNHDVAWALRAILGPKKADLVMRSSAGLQAIHGL